MSKIDNFLCHIVDQYYSLRPQPMPDVVRPKVVSHRGIHDNVTTFENTITAFDAAEQCDAWGIEFDVRWTKDAHPVVIHDENCKRVFGVDATIRDMTIVELKERLPIVPTLSEVIERYGEKCHLMIELKSEAYRECFPRILYDHLSCFKPCVDFHILSLDIKMFQYIDQLPSLTFLPVAEKNVTRMSCAALKKNYAGITGHYLLVNDQIIQTHKKQAQAIGTGFISSRNCLYREINRGVNWIFSNDIKKLTTYSKGDLP